MSTEYALQKLTDAVLEMAVNTGSLKSRTVSAYIHHLCLIEQKDLPSNLQPLLKEIRNSFTSVREKDGYDISMTVTQGVSVIRPKITAKKIARLFDKVSVEVRGADLQI